MRSALSNISTDYTTSVPNESPIISIADSQPVTGTLWKQTNPGMGLDWIHRTGVGIEMKGDNLGHNQVVKLNIVKPESWTQ